MAKIYSQKKATAEKMLPKKETIQLILQYSKVLKIVTVGEMTFESIAN